MRIRIQVIIEADQETTPACVKEVACFERGPLSPETLGLRLDEAKQMLAGVQQMMAAQQVENYVEEQRQCSHCQQPLTYKGHHQIALRTLFGKLKLSSPRFYTCSCQPHLAGGTQHFLVTYASVNDPDALARAQVILARCEADLATLETWFHCDYSQSPYTIWVHVASGIPGGGASNYVYEDSESSRIIIQGTYQPTNPTPYDIFDDFAQMLFVAELAEILMDFTGYGWNRGTSAGEALSRIAAAELHPASYYTSGAGNGPYVNAWLQLPLRVDWVSNMENTDQDPISYGCGAPFINYLAYQLGYQFSQIVSAGGSNLAQTFAKLTNQPASAAFRSFEALLEQHLPTGEKTNVPHDNVFPLWGPSNRDFGFSVSERVLSSIEQSAIYNITLEVCSNIPKQYSYQIENVTTQINVKSNAFGYADAKFTWLLNGVPLPVQNGSNGYVTVEVAITDSTPSPGQNPFMYQLSIQYSIVNKWNTSTLTFSNNNDFPGNATIDITVQAKEALVPGDPQTVHTETWPF